KVPSAFEFRADLPRNMLGKVLRRVLRDEYEALRAQVNRDDPIPPEPDSTMPAATGQPAPAPAPAPRHALLAEPDAVPVAERPTPAGRGLVDELERLARLRDAGALTDEEFSAAKARLLAERRA
ncbi:MAG TPA: SHOCT domain-containing protein, partial [Jatrophihabitans sp.]|nr:SHOCT domain-containing protein [Jatrophihabitans sp.]